MAEYCTRWWFQIFLIFTPNLGEDSHFDYYVSNGLKLPTSSPFGHMVHLFTLYQYVPKRVETTKKVLHLGPEACESTKCRVSRRLLAPKC